MNQAARRSYPSEIADKLQLRFPEGMRNKIKDLAKANRRSMNAEIIFILERALEGAEAATGVQFGDQAPAAVGPDTAVDAAGQFQPQ